MNHVIVFFENACLLLNAVLFAGCAACHKAVENALFWELVIHVFLCIPPCGPSCAIINFYDLCRLASSAVAKA